MPNRLFENNPFVVARMLEDAKEFFLVTCHPKPQPLLWSSANANELVEITTKPTAREIQFAFTKPPVRQKLGALRILA